MPYLLDWTSHSLIRKRFLHSKESLIRYLLSINIYKTVEALSQQSRRRSLTLFLFFVFFNVMFRLPILAASPLPYFLMTSTTTCALLTKRCSAHLHTLRFLSPMKSSSILESQKPSSSVLQVPTFITGCFPAFKKHITNLTLLFCVSPGAMSRILRNFLLSECPPVPLPPYSGREIATWN